MNRLFRRFAALVLLAVTLATLLIYLVFRMLFGDPLEQIATRQAAGQIFLLEQYIDKAPSDEWLVRLNKVREVSDTRLELLPLAGALAALPPGRHADLQRGAIVVDVAGKSFYRRVDLNGARYIDSDAEVIHAQQLPIDIGEALGMEAIRFGIVALCLLLPIGWWSRRHWHGLLALSRVAEEYGRGQLDARVQLPASSSMGPLAARMHEMAGRIAGLLDARKHLLHSVSHELRTPIARLEFGLELLRAAAADPALEQRIVAMEGDVDELKALVSELLELTRLDHAQSMRRQPFALNPLLREQVDACGQALRAGTRGLRLDDDVDAALGTMEGDRRLLARALANLLGNGVKYAAKRIALTASRDGAGNVRIVIADDGPGIPPEAREQVFEPFYRLGREQDLTAGGYGLGLAIARKAVQLHGGAIAIEQSALGGAAFVVTLPAGAAL
ncbi:two-component sensor histidine kinase [Oxalobacteraceae bacterium]|nr:two-component sensor histidine kinase [Oxalobacteraceae bacterium]